MWDYLKFSLPEKLSIACHFFDSLGRLEHMTLNQIQNEVASFIVWHVDDVRALSLSELRETVFGSPYLRQTCGNFFG